MHNNVIERRVDIMNLIFPYIFVVKTVSVIYVEKFVPEFFAGIGGLILYLDKYAVCITVRVIGQDECKEFIAMVPFFDLACRKKYENQKQADGKEAWPFSIDPFSFLFQCISLPFLSVILYVFTA